MATRRVRRALDQLCFGGPSAQKTFSDIDWAADALKNYIRCPRCAQFSQRASVCWADALRRPRNQRVRAEVQLLQPESVSAQYGRKVQLPCNASGYVFSLYWIAWLKQVPSKGPVFMGRKYPGHEESDITESFTERFNISVDGRVARAYLDISDVRLEDAAIYYCARAPQ
ncbi:unnamed protein product [Ranitomeya imitator]|uniref:Ig-like domain-containing protein n=1 Tax=Ranitomeya imitator TaxID=111125 RepID=A0ABN9LLL4_9NEOB|nr:unnamed protein product [Ranitomeya imitator]